MSSLFSLLPLERACGPNILNPLNLRMICPKYVKDRLCRYGKKVKHVQSLQTHGQRDGRQTAQLSLTHKFDKIYSFLLFLL